MYYTLRNRIVEKVLPTPTRKITTPSDFDNGTPQVVKHELYTTYTNVSKFSGDADSVDIDTFLERVDTYIANKGVAEDHLKIETLKRYIDAEKGKARHVIRYEHLNAIKTYKEYKESFRKHFKTRSDLDPLRTIVKILKIKTAPQDSWASYLAKMDVCKQELVNLLRNSDWRADDTHITIDQIAKIIIISKILTETDQLTAERLHKDLKKDSYIGEIEILLENYAEMPGHVATYVLPVNSTSEQTGSDHRQSRTHSRDRGRNEFRTRSSSRPRYTTIECYNCHKPGHTARECYNNIVCENCQYEGHHESICWNVSWCNHHQMIGHKTRDCRAR